MGLSWILDVCWWLVIRVHHERTDIFRHIYIDQIPYIVGIFLIYIFEYWILSHKVVLVWTLTVHDCAAWIRSFLPEKSFCYRGVRNIHFINRCLINLNQSYLFIFVENILRSGTDWATWVGSFRTGLILLPQTKSVFPVIIFFDRTEPRSTFDSVNICL